MVPTQSAGSGGEQAREAIQNGSDTIFACGGDGTMHDVLQGIIGTDAALGLLPLGTANALAYDLRIPSHPEKAVRTQLCYEPRRIAAGVIRYAESAGSSETAQRYFAVMCGAGPDATMVYELSAGWKHRYGIFGYALQSLKMYATHHFAPFVAEYVDDATGERRTTDTPWLMAVRITDFGNVMRKLAPGAGLERGDLRVVVLNGSARLRFPVLLAASLTGYTGNLPGIERAYTREVHLRAAPGESMQELRTIHTEADGEFLGRLPASISILPNAFTLLMPPRSA
jgi:diacylglycerol kinase family enzyme